MSITWDCFKYVNSANKSAAFESMCRLLFKHQFTSNVQIIHTNPNNVGIECEPITRESDGKRISFQAKFFENGIGYKQIEDSMNKAVSHYADQLDIIYLYCNKNVTTTSKSYEKIKKNLEQNKIELIPVCDEAILDLLVIQQDKDVIKNIRKQYFTLQNPPSDIKDAQSKDITIVEQSKMITALSTQVEGLQPIADDHKKLADTLYNEILQLNISHDERAMWEKLKPYVEDARNISNKNYVNYFHLAAQLCLKFCREDSEKYFNIAVKLYDKLDQRLYRAAALMEDEKHNEALRVLGYINSVNVLNQYLFCLYNLERGSECENILSEHSDIITDDLTIFVLGLCYLQSSNFDQAEENIGKLLEVNRDSLKYQYAIAAIRYWRNFPFNGHINPSLGLAIPGVEEIYATTEQINGLNNAAALFEKLALDSAGKSAEIRKMALSGCLLCAWITNDVKKYEYRDELLRTDIADCVAISFNLMHKEKISPESISTLTKKIAQSDSGHELVLLLKHYLDNKNIAKFNELVEQHEDILAKLPQNTVLALRVDALLSEEDYIRAENYINACSLNTEERERALFVIVVNNKSSRKNQIEKLGKELITKYGAEVDYYNLIRFYHSHEKWSGLAHITEKWYEKYGNVLALRYRAIALYNKGKRDEAAAVLQDIEKVAVLTPALHDLKINILVANSQFDHAIAIINETSFRTDDERVIRQISSLYANKGDFESAAAVLKEFISRHPDSIQATEYLIQHLERIDINEAYSYAKHLASHYPNNPKILLNWMNIGFKTSNDNEVASVLPRISALQKNKKVKNKTNCWFKVHDIQSLLKFLKEQEDLAKKIYDTYYYCQAPIHVVLDQNNRKLGEFIYSNWKSETGTILFWHYGGKPDTLFIKNIQYKRIIMDYTACLTAYCLSLFPALEKYFEIIYIEPFLLQVINSEIISIKNSVQPSREEKDRSLLDFIDTHKDKITIINQPDIEDIENAGKASGVELSDANKYLSAKSVNAVIITDSFSTELVKRQPPQEYEDIRERTQVLFDILIENDVLQGEIITNENDRKIKSGDSILVDNVVLDELADKGLLSDFIKLFKVHIMQIIYRNLQDAKHGRENRQTLLSWLTDFESVVKGYIESGKIKYLKQYPNSSVKTPELQILTQSLYRCALAFTANKTEDSPTALWSDDRYLNKCNWTVNVFDILRVLKHDAAISDEDYNRHISELIKRGVKYYVPDTDYIFACLLKAQTQTDDCSIAETPRLEAIRKSVNESLSEQSKIGKEVRKVGEKFFDPPEYGEYIIRLRESFQKVIARIWEEKSRDNVWKAVVSTWCLTNLSDFVCDVTFANKNEAENTLSFKHFSLIHWTLLISESFRRDYADWIFAFLGYRWRLFPEEYSAVVNQTADFINGLQDENTEKTKFLQEYLLQKYYDYLPAPFVYSLFVSPVFNGKWESRNPYEITHDEEPVADDSLNQEQERKPFKPIEAVNHFDYLKSNPDKWLEMFRTIAASNKEKPHNAIIEFIMEYINKHGTGELPRECLVAIASFSWQCPPEYIAAASEIRRKLP